MTSYPHYSYYDAHLRSPGTAQTSETAGKCRSTALEVCTCLKALKTTVKRLHESVHSMNSRRYRRRPAARMNCPSRDTLMELQTVGISKSWMSSILLWISVEEITTCLLMNDRREYERERESGELCQFSARERTETEE